MNLKKYFSCFLKNICYTKNYYLKYLNNNFKCSKLRIILFTLKNKIQVLKLT